MTVTAGGIMIHDSACVANDLKTIWVKLPAVASIACSSTAAHVHFVVGVLWTIYRNMPVKEKFSRLNSHADLPVLRQR